MNKAHDPNESDLMAEADKFLTFFYTNDDGCPTLAGTLIKRLRDAVKGDRHD